MKSPERKVVMDIDAIGKSLAKKVKTQGDLTEIMGQLTKRILESALNAEIENHLGYEKNDKAKTRRSNTRNGYSSKTIKCDRGELEIDTPRDREATFEPKIYPKAKLA